MFIPPPPTFYDYERPRPRSVTSGPGFGFYVKAGLLVAGIFGVASVLSNAAATTREVRHLVRPPRNETSGG